jgi:predicted TPR repeat methyltransferase
MAGKAPDLHAAYQLSSPDDSRRLYAQWAKDYDSGFVTSEDYQLHLHTARAFVEAGGAGPVLDVGAGTGICGVALADLGVSPIDATDISAEMLDQAKAKGVYRAVIQADLTKRVPIADGTYSGIVSSGTFTTGHVGPDAFDELLRVAAPGAQFALSINAKHFSAAGFEAKLTALAGQIAALTLPETRIYGAEANGPHQDDTAFVALFRKA